MEIRIIHKNFVCGCLNSRVGAFDAQYNAASNGKYLKTFRLLSHDRLNIVAESNLPLGCAHIGGRSKYAISCVSPTAACPPPPPSVAYALYLRDHRIISIHIAALCPRHTFRLTGTANVYIACRTGASAKTPVVLESPPVVVDAFNLARQ
jgi:hypothetical protein